MLYCCLLDFFATGTDACVLLLALSRLDTWLSEDLFESVLLVEISAAFSFLPYLS